MYRYTKTIIIILTLICTSGYALTSLALNRVQDPQTSPTQVTVLVENLAPARGTWLTPFWVGFHDGTFDLFDVGSTASSELEGLAEDGNTDLLSEQFGLSRAGSVQGVIVSDPILPPLAPGEFASMSFTLDPMEVTNRYFSHECMVIPSNDAFLGNDDPMAYPIFDASGNFLGLDLIMAGSDVLDAGTESNDELPDNTAFFGQTIPNSGNGTDAPIMTHPGYHNYVSSEEIPSILGDPMFVNADFKKAPYNSARIWIYDQALPSLTVSPTTEVSPGNVEIPSTGGNFDASFRVSSDPSTETTPYEFNVWIMLTMPDGTQLGPVFGPIAATLPAGESMTFNHIQNIPASYPPGYYLCKTYIGSQYAGVIYGGSSFEFQKLTTYTTNPYEDLRHRVNGMGSGESGAQIGAASYALLGSRPNPFNPETTIQYALPQASPVKLNIFDASGRLVQSLVNGWREAGIHEVTFNGANLASGIYLYRISASEFNASGKMVLMK